MTRCALEERWDTVSQELLRCENSRGAVDRERESGKRKRLFESWPPAVSTLV